MSTGVIGLISAIDHFDPTHNVKLKTYAEYKIRGAILDSLRGLDWAPRQKRRQAKQIETAISHLEQSLHRTPSEDEIAAELGVSIAEYHEWLVEIRGLNVGSLEGASNEQGVALRRAREMACAACGASLRGGELADGALRCLACQRSYFLPRAGRSLAPNELSAQT